jgi:hypothetical protein
MPAVEAVGAIKIDERASERTIVTMSVAKVRLRPGKKHPQF